MGKWKPKTGERERVAILGPRASLSVYPGFVEHLGELVDPVQEHLHLVLEVLPVLGGPVGLALEDVDLLLLLEQVRLHLVLVGLGADQRVLQGN